MPKKTLEEIKATADEYVKVVQQLERAEQARDGDRFVLSYQKKLQAALGKHEAKITKLSEKADRLKRDVLAFVVDKKNTYKAESELATFGVTVGTKQLERQPDKKKLWDLCKKKGVEFFDLVTVMLAEADKRLGTKEIDAISERRTKATRNEYLRLKS